ncbi:MAG: CDGSH iron-sulfur domain-containing protein [Pirellulales bacterium]|nr:CDGSH iron-sulfur domain-containing protein [Pirellulales bacterium]
MSNVRIRCRVNGPLVVEGPVTIVDHLGQEFTAPADKPLVALCRCGQSQRKPFCDGSHKTASFVAEETANRPLA